MMNDHTHGYSVAVGNTNVFLNHFYRTQSAILTNCPTHRKPLASSE